MAAYSDTAKTYTQLSLGALVLSVTFFDKVLGQHDRIPVDLVLLLAWVCWLVAVLAGAFYQYLAVRFLEARGKDWGLLQRSGHTQAFETWRATLEGLYGPHRWFLSRCCVFRARRHTQAEAVLMQSR
jgi:hypothetical protein